MSYFKKACMIPVIHSGDIPMYLLVKSSRGNWIFPKGSINKKETTYEAAVREAEEEAGISTPELKLHATSEPVGSYTYKIKSKRIPVIVYMIESDDLHTVYKESKIRERKLCTYKEAKKLLGRRSVRRILRALNKELRNVKNGK